MSKRWFRKSPPDPPEPGSEAEEPATPRTFVEIGGSPVPGVRLRQVLRGHTSSITGLAWTPDAAMLLSASSDRTARVWDVATGKELRQSLSDVGPDWSEAYLSASIRNSSASLPDAPRALVEAASAAYPEAVAWKPDEGPALRDLQALPKEGKPLIEFAQPTGARDRAWKEIAQHVETLAAAKGGH